MLCDVAVVLLCLVGEEEGGEGLWMWLGWVVVGGGGVDVQLLCLRRQVWRKWRWCEAWCERGVV